ncbi:hypothetical protein GCM10010327_57790 [Streptomyces nitrosporeus]|nr:hypothetical protein GCM10010327_57790 [Streptomyces nitrosporeus]
MVREPVRAGEGERAVRCRHHDDALLVPALPRPGLPEVLGLLRFPEFLGLLRILCALGAPGLPYALRPSVVPGVTGFPGGALLYVVVRAHDAPPFHTGRPGPGRDLWVVPARSERKAPRSRRSWDGEAVEAARPAGSRGDP